MTYLDDFVKNYRSKRGLRKKDDSRVPKLTLYHLNKLKKMEAVRKLEHVRRKELLKSIYGKPKEDEGGL